MPGSNHYKNRKKNLRESCYIAETTDDHDYAINLENEIFQTSRGSEEKPYRTTRPWTPLQLRNEIYDEVLKERAAAANRKNFLADNIVSCLFNLASINQIACKPLPELLMILTTRKTGWSFHCERKIMVSSMEGIEAVAADNDRSR